MRPNFVVTLLIATLFIQFFMTEQAGANSKKNHGICVVALSSSAKEKEFNHLIKAGFSESVALRIVNYYPK